MIRMFLCGLLLIGLGVMAGAQEMIIHSGDGVIRVNLTSIDSLTFSLTEALPPSSIEIEVNSEGVDGMGATWILEVSALILDAERTPVSDGFFVNFSVDLPDVQIEDALTGNTNMAGDSQEGVAFTQLIYHSRDTNQEVVITASLPPFKITESLDFTLPIQEPQGLICSNLLNWNYPLQNQNPEYVENTAEFDIEVYVTDGHDHWINGQLVRFITNMGRFYSHRDPSTYNRWNVQYLADRELTGQGDIDDHEGNPLPNDGWADLWLVICLEEAFPEPLDSSIANVGVELVGLDITCEPIILILYNPRISE